MVWQWDSVVKHYGLDTLGKESCDPTQENALPPYKHSVQLLLVNLLEDNVRGRSQLCCILALPSASSVMQGSIVDGCEAVSNPAVCTCTA